MTRVLIDRDVLLDVAMSDPVWAPRRAVPSNGADDHAVLVINPLVYTGCPAVFQTIEELESALPPDVYRREDLPYEAAFLAGKSFLAYRRGGGIKRSPLPKPTRGKVAVKVINYYGDQIMKVFNT